MSTLVRLSKDNDIAIITIDNPPVNALSPGVPEGIANAIAEVNDDPSVKAAILIGGGRTFVAGADIKEFGKMTSGKSRGAGLLPLLLGIENCSKPVVMAIHGAAFGGGLELAMAGHYRVASSDAQVGQPEVKLGLLPGGGGTQRLPRLVGKGRALQLILSGEMISAQEAYRIGLVNEVVPAANLIGRAEAILKKVAANAPIAVKFALEAANKGVETSQAEGLLLEASYFGLCAATEDKKEGTTAFFEKRAPQFQGR